MGGTAHISARRIVAVGRHSNLSPLSIIFRPAPPCSLWGLRLRALHSRKRDTIEPSQVIYVDADDGTSTRKARSKARLLLLKHNTVVRLVRSRLSKTKIKNTRPSPSNHLISVLVDLKCHEAIPALRPNVPDQFNVKRTSASTGGPRESKLNNTQLPLQRPGQFRERDITALQHVLARYLEHIHPILNSGTAGQDIDATLDLAIPEAFPQRILRLLESKGYHPEDVVTWAWITTATDAERATLRLSMATIRLDADGNSAGPIPIFVFLFLLRRKHINAKTLRALMVYAWSRLRGVQAPPSAFFPAGRGDQVERYQLRMCQDSAGLPLLNRTSLRKLDEATFVAMVVRLLRHARRVWVQAIVSVADMIVAYMDESMGCERTSRLKPVTAARLTLIHNRILSLLSLPSKTEPFLSVPHYQRAQFCLIKKMGEFKPPLAITQEGYRAVVKVQLAHKKTLPERRWAEKQAKSWPPWKKIKLGIDAEEQPDEGISRAMEAMNRMREAGYKGDSWEDAASIYAGWDTDGSPTIQTRAIIRPASRKSWKGRSSGESQLSEASLPDREVPDVWAARIRATRTVQEAWACFLVHEDLRLPFTPDIYHAMFEKLVFERIRVNRHRWKWAGYDPNPTRMSLPGDGKEVFPAPVSPNEAVYVRSEPPELVDLFDRMIREGMQPTERCLAFLVTHAGSPALSIKFLRSSGVLSLKSLRILTGLGISPTTQDNSQNMALREIPERIFAAFISFLCGLPTSLLCGVAVWPTRDRPTPGEQEMAQSITESDNEVSPLIKAFDLVYARRPQGRPAWNALLAALARYGVHFGSGYGQARSALLQDLMSWRLICDIVRQMRALNIEIDTQSFQMLCLGLEKSIFSCLGMKGALLTGLEGCVLPSFHPLVKQGSSQLVHLDVEAEHLLNGGAAYIKSAFATLVGYEVHAEPKSPAVVGHLSRGTEDEMQGLPPSLLSVPGPYHVHAYIRVLGLLRDYQGLLTLVQWMARFADELHAVAKELGNGARLQRRCLIALRVFLERSWEIRKTEANDGSATSSRASEEVITRVRNIMTDVEYWGSWPEDEEVKLYCKGRRLL